MSRTTDTRARENAEAGMAEIRRMVAALEVDYDRLNDLLDQKRGLRSEARDRGLVLYRSDDVWHLASEAGQGGPIPVTSDISAYGPPESDGRVWTGSSSDSVFRMWATFAGVMSSEEFEELAELEEAAGQHRSEDDAREYIRSDPLSLQIRGGWRSPGEENQDEEFEILLTTGGPALRIIGELDEHNEPCNPRLQFQDWFTPWEELIVDSDDREALLKYCQVFYFG